MKRLGATLIGVLLHVVSAAAQEPLSLHDVYRDVRAANPRLHAGAAIVVARGAMESSAGLLPDPEIEIGAMNLSLPGLSADMPSSMAPSVRLMQMFPPFGRRGIKKRIARQSTRIAQFDADESWWEVRAEAAMAFYEVYQADRQVAVMTETVRLLQDYRKVTQAMYSAGEGRQTDVLRASVEVARMEADLVRMNAMRTAASARLNALLNQPANMEIRAVSLPALPATIPSVDSLRVWADAARPMLARGRAEIDQAAARLDLAKKEIWPDFTVGVQYGQRRAAMAAADGMPTEYETERMGSVMLGFAIPVYAGKRQLKMREEAAAMQQMAQYDFTRMRLQVDARIVELTAELDRNRTLLALYKTDVLPQAEATLQSAYSAYRVGQVDYMTLVDAQMTTNQYRQDVIALLAGYGSAIAELEMTIGRELPVGTALRAGEE
jgi:cobalt-zinc-cadmium efflux system outer membrane protein